MSRPIDLLPNYLKLIIALAYDLAALSLAYLFAYVVRLGLDDIPFSWDELAVFITTATSTLALFYFFGVYSSIVRYFNEKSFIRIVSLLLASSIILYLSGHLFQAFVPRSVPIVFLVFSVILIAGARAIVSLLLEKQWFDEREGVVIYGAGYTGRQLMTALSSGRKYQPLAFIDQKERYQGRSLSGLKIYSPNDLQSLIKKFGQFKVLIAIAQVDPERMKDVVEKIEPYALELLTIPSMYDIVSGKHTIDEVREISVDELLGREAVMPIPELLSANIENKTVMISGAGGSIGKELCRQIIDLEPKKLIMFDISEAFLYEINQELLEYSAENGMDIPLVALIGDVKNGMLMTQIFHKHQVQTIYHAAAYKHVPMVENNVVAGLTNNVLGTFEIAKAAVECQVETFVLISTDKAVRPTNVMGASKRFAELILQALAKRDHKTRFIMVRFGNVLGSSGSVVPLFKSQIKKGGPITVTHPDIIRYFMTIPEAAQLVIQAGAMGKGGDVFVLDMGSPVKIVELAYKMTHLMGLTIKDEANPQGDIEIQYSGLRPGEKLFEELLIDDCAEKTSHKRILTANEKSISWNELTQLLDRLIQVMADENIDHIKALLLEAPLGYQPKDEENIKASNYQRLKSVS